MSADEFLDCQACGARFHYDALLAEEGDDTSNTQAHWLVRGRCPTCFATVEFSFARIREIAARAEPR